MGFPGGSEVKACACSLGDLGSIPGLGRFPGEGNGSPLQYSCLENPMNRGACVGYTPQGSKELDTTEQLHFTFNNLQSEASFLIFLAFGVSPSAVSLPDGYPVISSIVCLFLFHFQELFIYLILEL